jgi:hypothetical protein
MVHETRGQADRHGFPIVHSPQLRNENSSSSYHAVYRKLFRNYL